MCGQCGKNNTEKQQEKTDETIRDFPQIHPKGQQQREQIENYNRARFDDGLQCQYELQDRKRQRKKKYCWGCGLGLSIKAVLKVKMNVSNPKLLMSLRKLQGIK